MIELLFTMWQLDGTLTVNRSTDCEYLIKYENRLDAGPGDEFYEVEGAHVHIIKGPGNAPERMIILVNGKFYSTYVNDNTTGEICVPVYLGF